MRVDGSSPAFPSEDKNIRSWILCLDVACTADEQFSCKQYSVKREEGTLGFLARSCLTVCER